MGAMSMVVRRSIMTCWRGFRAHGALLLAFRGYLPQTQTPSPLLQSLLSGTFRFGLIGEGGGV